VKRRSGRSNYYVNTDLVALFMAAAGETPSAEMT
jgi:hypothetical protein